MKYWKTKPYILGTALVLLMLLLSLFETPTMALGANLLHFDPDESSTSCDQSVDVVLVADIDEQNPVIATMINFTFDKNCLEITNVVENTADWPGGITMQDLDWVNENGGVMITTNVGLNPGLTGSVPIATITLRGKNCAGCTSSLHLSQGEYTTSLMETIYPELDDGTFTTIATATPTPTATSTTTPTPTLSPTLTPTTTPTLTPTPTLSPTVTATITPNPSPTPIPTLTPIPPSPPASGLSAGAWAGIGIAILLCIALGIWLIMRRRS